MRTNYFGSFFIALILFLSIGVAVNAQTPDFSTVNISLESADDCFITPARYSFDASTIGADAYFWDFGNGRFSDLPTVTVTYTDQGIYTPSLTVVVGSDSSSFTNVFVDRIVVHGVKPVFQVCNGAACIDDDINIRNLSKDPFNEISEKRWELSVRGGAFAQLNIAAENIDDFQLNKTLAATLFTLPTDPLDQYLKSELRLIIVTSNGCRDTVTSLIRPTKPDPHPSDKNDIFIKAVEAGEGFDPCTEVAVFYQPLDTLERGLNQIIIDLLFFDAEEDGNALNPELREIVSSAGDTSEVYIFEKGEEAAYTVWAEYQFTDFNSCEEVVRFRDSVEIAIQEKPIAEFVFEMVIDSTCRAGAVSFTDSSYVPPKGGTPSSIISAWEWDFGDGSTFSGQVPPVHNYAAGTYTASLIVFSSFSSSGGTIVSCTDTLEQTIVIEELDQISAVQDSVIFICEGSSTQLLGNNFASTGQVFYTWTNLSTNDTITNSGATNAGPSVSPMEDTRYQLAVRFSNCPDTITGEVNVRVISSSLLPDSDTTYKCIGETVDFDATINQSLPDSLTVEYLWELKGIEISQEPQLTVIDPGVYDLFVLIRKGSGNGNPIKCSLPDRSFSVFDIQIPIKLVSDTSLCFFDDENQVCFQQASAITKELLLVEVLPDFTYTLNGTVVEQPVVTEGGTFLVNATHNTFDCSIDYQIVISEICNPKMCYPSAIVYGDPIEGVFYGQGGVYEIINLDLKYELFVYDRLGQIVFKTTSPALEDGWNGKRFNTGDALPTGVYGYKYSYQSVREGDGMVTGTGSVSLLRK